MMHSALSAPKCSFCFETHASQWATDGSSGIVALLFLAQAFLGGLLAHYRVETGAFFTGSTSPLAAVQLGRRTWHLQLAISGLQRPGWAAACSWRRGRW